MARQRGAVNDFHDILCAKETSSNGDCQWSNGACHMRRNITKGEWHSWDTSTQGCCGGHVLGSVDLHIGG